MKSVIEAVDDIIEKTLNGSISWERKEVSKEYVETLEKIATLLEVYIKSRRMLSTDSNELLQLAETNYGLFLRLRIAGIMKNNVSSEQADALKSENTRLKEELKDLKEIRADIGLLIQKIAEMRDALLLKSMDKKVGVG